MATAREYQAGRAAYSLPAHLLLTALAILFAVGVFQFLKQRAESHRCRENLQRIYAAFELYDAERGSLPVLSFFPDNPLEDRDSFVLVLEPYGITRDNCSCPADPGLYRAECIPYVWNTDLNARKLSDLETPQWMLTEIEALSPDVPAPHRGKYHVLYSDGSVVATRTPPAALREP